RDGGASAIGISVHTCQKVNQGTSIESGWPRRRIVFAFLFLFSIQVGAIYLFGERLLPPLRSREPSFHMTFMSATPKAYSQSLTPWQDPTLFVLPSRNGFSGGAWLSYTRPEHVLDEWREPLTWLARNPKSVARGVPEEALARSLDRTAGLPK